MAEWVPGTRRTVLAVITTALLMAAAAPAGALQTTIGGRQVDLDATLNIREVIEENHATTHERTLELLRVRTAVALADWLRFDATTAGTHGGSTAKSNRAGLYNWNDVFQDVSPAVDFEEAYVDLFLPSVDVRLGKQKVAWGKLDRTQPNDLINPRSYLDPLITDEAEQKIGVPALQASYYVPESWGAPAESRLTAVWVPRYVPYRFGAARCDVVGGVSHCDVERWFPPAAVPPPTFSAPLPPGSPVPSLTVPLGFRTENVPPPAWRFDNSEIGLRYSALVRDVDLALYYFHGFDVQPAFRLSATAFGRPSATPPLFVDPASLFGVTTLSPVFHHIDSWGADFAYAFDRFTIRGEGAFIRGRSFNRDLRTLLADATPIAPSIEHALGLLAMGRGSADVPLPESVAVRDAVEWGLGGDYVYEGYMLLLQVNQTDVLHNDVDLLIKDVETRLLANLRKSFFADTLQTQLVAVYALESDYTLLRPRALYRFTDNFAAEVGYLFVAGRAHSIGGQYRRNDEGWVRFECKL